MKQKLSILLFVSLLFFSTSLFAKGDQPFTPQNSTWQNPATDWFHNAKLGAFMHFLLNKDNFNLTEQFDVEGLADQLSDAGAPYFVFTLGQNSGYYNAPNEVYDKLGGYKSGERCSKRDLPMELAKALKKRGIRFMLYLPCQTPNHDLNVVKAFGFPAEPINNDRHFTQEGAQHWASVIKCWSKRYGKLVSGWWFDGGYTTRCGFNSEIASLYAKAAKAGNKNSIVTFNPGIKLIKSTSAEDYTAGEINEPLKIQINDRWIEGSQAHILTYLGDTWGAHNLRYDDNIWIDWIKGINSKGGVVTMDMGTNYNPQKGKVGLYDNAQIHQLKNIIQGLK